jgi:hypothetical protein
MPGSARLLRRSPAGTVLSRKAASRSKIQRRRVQNENSAASGGKINRDVACAVGRVVVDDNQLPVTAKLETGSRLRNQRGQAGGERLFLVAGWNNDRELELVSVAIVFCVLGHDFVL